MVCVMQSFVAVMIWVTLNKHWDMNNSVFTPGLETPWGSFYPHHVLEVRLSRHLYVTKIVLFMGISGWNFVRVPKAMLWAHIQSFSLNFSAYMLFLALYMFARLYWKARETLVKQPPGQHSAIRSILLLAHWYSGVQYTYIYRIIDCQCICILTL